MNFRDPRNDPHLKPDEIAAKARMFFTPLLVSPWRRVVSDAEAELEKWEASMSALYEHRSEFEAMDVWDLGVERQEKNVEEAVQALDDARERLREREALVKRLTDSELYRL